MESKKQAHEVVQTNSRGGDYTRDCGMLRGSGRTAGENCKMEAVLAQFGGVDPNLQKHFPLFGKEQSPHITLNDLPLCRARITGKVLPLISDVATY